MTNAASHPEQGVADALTELSEQSRVLVRREIDAAQQEMWDKAKAWLPAAGLVGTAAVASTFAGASAYRLSMRIVEKLFPPATAAFVATAGFATLAGLAAAQAAQKARSLSPPVPTAAVRETSAAAGWAAQQAAGEAGSES